MKVVVIIKIAAAPHIFNKIEDGSTDNEKYRKLNYEVVRS
jgi:hypothetical protein